ncbi:MAG: GNAT family N-acetyltransferase [Jatrophihabitans sp.]|uniref:GNAT family N-acetyltransferase n=1 Tax=Jatrophihabitans sp. TaxID=1932789 RepID=UPI003F7CF6A3
MDSSSAVTYRLAESGDSDAVRRVNGAAFGGRRVPDLVDALAAAGDVVASLVACRLGTVIGHVQLSRCWIDARERLVEVVTLSPLAVAPSHQRQGIGTALVAEALRTARERGEPAVFLEGDPNFYGARGFSSARSRGFDRPSPRIPEPGFQVALFDPGLPRGPFVYCQTFWIQDCVGLRDPQLASVEARSRYKS